FVRGFGARVWIASLAQQRFVAFRAAAGACHYSRDPAPARQAAAAEHLEGAHADAGHDVSGFGASRTERKLTEVGTEQRQLTRNHARSGELALLLERGLQAQRANGKLGIKLVLVFELQGVRGERGPLPGVAPRQRAAVDDAELATGKPDRDWAGRHEAL